MDGVASRCFESLIGGEAGASCYRDLADQLIGHAQGLGFVEASRFGHVIPTMVMDERAWQVEYKVCEPSHPRFVLAVIEPKIPSISPVPFQISNAPLFAVVVMEDLFVVAGVEPPRVQWRLGFLSSTVVSGLA